MRRWGSTWVKLNKRYEYDLEDLFQKLERVKFPKAYTEGIRQISLTSLRRPMNKWFGYYCRREIWINLRRHGKHGKLLTRSRDKVFETFVHEVAHHVDWFLEDDMSLGLKAEAKKLGRLIHKRANGNYEEYFARGFEKFYSEDPGERKKLKTEHPTLYRTILSLHKRYSSDETSAS
jgi:hypothetical protein